MHKKTPKLAHKQTTKMVRPTKHSSIDHPKVIKSTYSGFMTKTRQNNNKKPTIGLHRSSKLPFQGNILTKKTFTSSIHPPVSSLDTNTLDISNTLEQNTQMKRYQRQRNTQPLVPLFFINGPPPTVSNNSNIGHTDGDNTKGMSLNGDDVNYDRNNNNNNNNTNNIITTNPTNTHITHIPTSSHTNTITQSNSSQKIKKKTRPNKHKDGGDVPFPPLDQFSHTRTLSPDELVALTGPEQVPETKKLKRQQIASSLPHVFTLPASHLKKQQLPLKNNWKKHVFRNDGDLVVELGCGIGQYIVGLAEYNKNMLMGIGDNGGDNGGVDNNCGNGENGGNNDNNGKVDLNCNNNNNNNNTNTIDSNFPNNTNNQTHSNQGTITRHVDNNRVHLPTKHKLTNYIGLEKKGSRLYIGAIATLQKQLKNTAFICGSFDFVGLMFGKNEVNEIWLTFPDQNFHSNMNRHITSPHYIPLYNHILVKDGIIHLKTDQDEVFNYTMEQIELFNHPILEFHKDLYQYLDSNNGDDYVIEGDDGKYGNNVSLDKQFNHPLLPISSFINTNTPTPKDILRIKTYYEELWSGKGKTIKYVKFRLNNDIDYEKLLCDNFVKNNDIDDVDVQVE